MWQFCDVQKNKRKHLLAFDGSTFAFIRAIEKFTVEQLHTDDSKNELKQNIHDEDIYNIF